MSLRPLFLAAILAGLPAPVLAQAARDNIDALIEQQAKAQKVPASFIHKVVKRESNYNPHAKGGSALGLMQIKHATARGMGYKGDAAGLYDPETNLRYGVAYLAGAYRAAQGDLALAYQYYNRGYYFAAKRLGITTDVAERAPTPAPVAPASGSAFASLFTLRGGAAAPAGTGAALAYAPDAAGAMPTETVEVPLPPRRPSAFGGDAVQMASLAPAALADMSVTPAAPTQAAVVQGAPAEARPAESAGAVSESVDVPLPPRRPSVQMLASVGRPVAVARKAPAEAPVLEATALPPAQ
ncbi:transglycosylase SLT domain-containing protein [Methylobacterium sp. sgz302541]|uniref:transglycosylase SLT domain-containing protein n=1 Tax=unclassified Methylobacterium TaxID=2615210 RepID=UPI003D330E1E